MGDWTKLHFPLQFCPYRTARLDASQRIAPGGLFQSPAATEADAIPGREPLRTLKQCTASPYPADRIGARDLGVNSHATRATSEGAQCRQESSACTQVTNHVIPARASIVPSCRPRRHTRGARSESASPARPFANSGYRRARPGRISAWKTPPGGVFRRPSRQRRSQPYSGNRYRRITVPGGTSPDTNASLNWCLHIHELR